MLVSRRVQLLQDKTNVAANSAFFACRSQEAGEQPAYVSASCS